MPQSRFALCEVVFPGKKRNSIGRSAGAALPSGRVNVQWSGTTASLSGAS